MTKAEQSNLELLKQSSDAIKVLEDELSSLQAENEQLKTKAASMDSLFSKENIKELTEALTKAGTLTSNEVDNFTSEIQNDPGQLVKLASRMAGVLARTRESGYGVSKSASYANDANPDYSVDDPDGWMNVIRYGA